MEYFQDASGRKIAYIDEGKGLPIVLLHGFCGSSSYWSEAAPLLARSYRVIAPDLRGHGASFAPEGPYTIEEMADDIAALLDHLRVERAVPFGHSLGGYIALAFAERHPGRLRGLSLVHSTAYPDGEQAKENRLKAVQTIRTDGIGAFVDGLVPKLFAPEHVDSMADRVLRAKEIGYATPPQGAAGASLAMRERPDRNRVLAELELPILLVAGERDQIVPPERTFTVDGPNVSHATIPGAGHMSMMEAPEALVSVMTAYLDAVKEERDSNPES